MIVTILPSAGARNTPQVGAKALFRRRPIEPMLHVDFVRSVQIHSLGRMYAAC